MEAPPPSAACAATTACRTSCSGATSAASGCSTGTAGLQRPVPEGAGAVLEMQLVPQRGRRREERSGGRTVLGTMTTRSGGEAVGRRWMHQVSLLGGSWKAGQEAPEGPREGGAAAGGNDGAEEKKGGAAGRRRRQGAVQGEGAPVQAPRGGDLLVNREEIGCSTAACGAHVHLKSNDSPIFSIHVVYIRAQDKAQLLSFRLLGAGIVVPLSLCPCSFRQIDAAAAAAESRPRDAAVKMEPKLDPKAGKLAAESGGSPLITPRRGAWPSRGRCESGRNYIKLSRNKIQGSTTK
ncbi:uncharacterized protein LOC112875192 isoform X1 [Panicum hallii]|uniref:uncharacterized protein LOC112875192 isoform X1 n=1 Tax=Panicum hallii TaxID=206008 RepID=UPI000DF4D099|nr:uncharacterized protein LOC112875192 isoform X1 [Panicum hallii]